MKSKAIATIMLILFLASMTVITIPVSAQPNEVWVDDDFTSATPTWGTTHFATIQEGVDAVAVGGNIFVFNGTYYEHVTIDKSLTVVGEDRSTTIVDGNGTGSVIIITEDNANITGFTIQNSGTGPKYVVYSGIYLNYTNYCNITNNNIRSNQYGILSYFSNHNSICKNIISNNSGGIVYESSNHNIISGNNITNNTINFLYESSNNTINGNNITNNMYGIHIESSNNNGIYENIISNNDGPIELFGSSNNTLRNNELSNNKYNFGVHGSLLSHYIQDINDSNTVNGKPVYYWVNRRDMVVPLDAGWIALINCTHISVENLNLTTNVQGVLLAFTANSTITKNNIINNHYGIMLYESSNNTINGNNITENFEGIRLVESSNYNSISGNDMTNNYDGVSVVESSNNIISENDITENKGSGVVLRYSLNNAIYGNDMTNNRYYGIYLFDASKYNSISGNSVTNSRWGVSLYESSNNIIYHNNFVDNTEQVYSQYSINVWDDSYPSGGNHWSDYVGVDLYRGPNQDQLGSDGIGDTPYVIDANNQDRYPLMIHSFILTSLSIKLNKDTIQLGKKVRISGILTADEYPGRMKGTLVLEASREGLDWQVIKEFEVKSTRQYSFSHSWTPTEAGDYVVRARYGGDETYSASESDPVQLTVERAVTTLRLGALPRSTYWGREVKITVTLTSRYRTHMTGQIIVYTNGTAIRVIDVSDAVKMIEVFTWTPEQCGKWILTAQYSGDDNCQPSTAKAVTLEVKKIRTSLTLKFNATRIELGQAVNMTITLKVKSPPTDITGHFLIEYRIGSGDWILLDTITIEPGLTVETNYVWEPKEVGKYTIRVTYSGDEHYETSTKTKRLTVR